MTDSYKVKVCVSLRRLVFHGHLLKHAQPDWYHCIECTRWQRRGRPHAQITPASMGIPTTRLRHITAIGLPYAVCPVCTMTTGTVEAPFIVDWPLIENAVRQKYA